MTSEELTALETTLNRGKELLANLAHLQAFNPLCGGIGNDSFCGRRSEYLTSRWKQIVGHEIELIEAELSALTIPKPVEVIASESEFRSKEQIEMLVS